MLSIPLSMSVCHGVEWVYVMSVIRLIALVCTLLCLIDGYVCIAIIRGLNELSGMKKIYLMKSRVITGMQDI